jgi:hypothetical protein
MARRLIQKDKLVETMNNRECPHCGLINFQTPLSVNAVRKLWTNRALLSTLKL